MKKERTSRRVLAMSVRVMTVMPAWAVEAQARVSDSVSQVVDLLSGGISSSD
jgi:hypothetical protein